MYSFITAILKIYVLWRENISKSLLLWGCLNIRYICWWLLLLLLMLMNIRWRLVLLYCLEICGNDLKIYILLVWGYFKRLHSKHLIWIDNRLIKIWWRSDYLLVFWLGCYWLLVYLSIGWLYFIGVMSRFLGDRGLVIRIWLVFPSWRCFFFGLIGGFIFMVIGDDWDRMNLSFWFDN
jgi:hypothetical protein